MRWGLRRAVLTAMHFYHSAAKQQITGGFQMGLPTLGSSLDFKVLEPYVGSGHLGAKE